jgi:hypothetical protein
VICAATIFVVLLGMRSQLGSEEWWDYAVPMFLAAAILPGLFIFFICLLALFLVSFPVLMMRMVFGRELFFRRLNAALVIGSTPAGKAPALTITVPAVPKAKSRLRLRHSLYENPACREEIAAILQKEFVRPVELAEQSTQHGRDG